MKSLLKLIISTTMTNWQKMKIQEIVIDWNVKIKCFINIINAAISFRIFCKFVSLLLLSSLCREFSLSWLFRWRNWSKKHRRWCLTRFSVVTFAFEKLAESSRSRFCFFEFLCDLFDSRFDFNFAWLSSLIIALIVRFEKISIDFERLETERRSRFDLKRNEILELFFYVV